MVGAKLIAGESFVCLSEDGEDEEKEREGGCFHIGKARRLERGAPRVTVENEVAAENDRAQCREKGENGGKSRDNEKHSCERSDRDEGEDNRPDELRERVIEIVRFRDF